MRRHAGFSMVELMVALTIFSFGVLAVVALLGAGYRYEGRAQLDTQMTVIAEMKIEELRSVAGTKLADTVALVPGGGLDSDVAGYWESVLLDGRDFTVRWQVVTGPAGTRQLTVRAIAVARPSRNAELSTYVIHE